MYSITPTPLKSSDLQGKTIETLACVADFLEIPPFPPFEIASHNVTPYDTKIDEADRRYLKDIYLYEIKELERMLNWDLKSWLE